jgi:acid phosphatase (class A)
MRRPLARVVCVLILSACWARSASASCRAPENPIYSSGVDIDRILGIVGGPPADPSEEAADLRALSDAQRAATQERWDQALSDSDDEPEFVWRTLHVESSPPPRARAFFLKVYESVKYYRCIAKSRWPRVRPFVAHPDLKHPRVDGRVPEDSYPSGHATWGHTAGSILARMVPERREALLKRTRDYALRRGAGWPPNFSRA